MRADDLLVWVKASPFVPFRITLNSGKTYDIRHPELIKVTKTTFLFFFTDNPEAAADRFETVSLLLIERVEQLESQKSAK